MTSPWQLYDDLIDLIPPGIKVLECAVGNWAVVRSETGAGTAMVYCSGPRASMTERELVGRDLRDAAACVKSWDFELAALGAAALNSYLTTWERISRFPGDGPEVSMTTFERHADQFATTRTAVVGHFDGIETWAEGNDFIVLERLPSGSDLPDPAAEYVLGDRDQVFITGSTLTNKTLPRLLELCAHTRVVLVGPSVPFAPEALPACVAEVGGAVVADIDHVMRAISLGGSKAEVRSGLHVFNREIRRFE